MNLFRILAVVLACSLGASSVMAGNAGGGKGLPGGASGKYSGGSSSSPIAVWLVMGCAGSIIFAAFLASRKQKRELSGRETGTCGWTYLLRPRPR